MVFAVSPAPAYAAWLSAETGKRYRLPTEAEWEYAVRASSTTKYHFGDNEAQLCQHGNHADTSTDYEWRNTACSDDVGERTAEVGRYRPNAFGLYDMEGNVYEWVQDCWNNSYVGAPTDGRAWTSGDCGLRVVRGSAATKRRQPGKLKKKIAASRGMKSCPRYRRL